MATVNSAYCPDAADLVNPLAAPLMAQSHADLPPAYIAVAHFDPLRDSGVAYAKALTDARVSVEINPGDGSSTAICVQWSIARRHATRLNGCAPG
jgi:acetyl esterase